VLKFFRAPLRRMDADEAFDAPLRPGIVYLSHVPRGMLVTHVKQQMERYGEVTRMWLGKVVDRKTGELIPNRFKEGWIEFRRRRDARRAVLALNGNPVQANRRMGFAGNIWAVKYLRGIQWHQLSEERHIERQRSTLHQGRVRKELMDANDAYLRGRRRNRWKSEETPRWDGADDWATYPPPAAKEDSATLKKKTKAKKTAKKASGASGEAGAARGRRRLD